MKPTITADYQLKGIEIKNYRGIKHLEITNLPPAQWIFITGENGFGKTSLLRAIALGLAERSIQKSDKKEPFDPTQKIPKIDLRVQVRDNKVGETIVKEITVGFNTTGIQNHRPCPLAAYAPIKEIGRKKEIEEIDTIEGLINGYSVLYDIEHEIIETVGKRREALREMLKQVVPQLYDITVETENERQKIVYYEKSETGEAYLNTPLKLRDLGDGMQGIIKMVGDMVMRLTETNPPNTALKDLHGIVLIDEVDANLHPKYQFELPHLLSKVFPKVQFIAITHSPIPLLGAPRYSTTILTVTRTIEEGIQVKQWTGIDVQRMPPNTLLSSPIFGFEHLYGREVTPDEVETSDNYSDIVDDEEIKRNIAALREKGWL